MIDYPPGGLHSRKRGWIPVSPLGKCHRLVHCALICTGGLACVRSWGFSWKILSFQIAHLFTCIQVVRAMKRRAPASFLFLPDCNWRNDSTNMAIRSASHLFYSRITHNVHALHQGYIISLPYRTGFTESSLSPNNKVGVTTLRNSVSHCPKTE